MSAAVGTDVEILDSRHLGGAWTLERVWEPARDRRDDPPGRGRAPPRRRRGRAGGVQPAGSTSPPPASRPGPIGPGPTYGHRQPRPPRRGAHRYRRAHHPRPGRHPHRDLRAVLRLRPGRAAQHRGRHHHRPRTPRATRPPTPCAATASTPTPTAPTATRSPPLSARPAPSGSTAQNTYDSADRLMALLSELLEYRWLCPRSRRCGWGARLATGEPAPPSRVVSCQVIFATKAQPRVAAPIAGSSRDRTLVWADLPLPTPEPGPGEVRVRLTYSGVNPGEIKNAVPSLTPDNARVMP